MDQYNSYILRGKMILSLSAICLIAAICLVGLKDINFQREEPTFDFETYDTQKMATAKVAVKKAKSDNVFTSLVSNSTSTSKFEAVTLENRTGSAATVEQLSATPAGPTWRLPTEQGYITQYEHWGHVALDITSARGTNERIYPVADGVITGIFQDNYGAKIVTVNHNINGKHYTSQYVHLSWYAPGIYVGQTVTTNTCLGGMGATGIATGIHLHITVLDCNLYDVTDPNCSTIGGFYNYSKVRLNQGFKGLRSVMTVPQRWYSR